MSTVIGLDMSLTGTGVVALRDGKLLENMRIEPKAKGGVPRLLEIEKEITAHLACVKPQLVIIEGYAFARPNQAHQIGELGGVIRRMLVIGGWRYIEVAPKMAKKFCTGKGTAPKEIILQQVYKRWGAEFQTSDEADAYVLAKIGEALLAKERTLTAFQAEVIHELEKKKGVA